MVDETNQVQEQAAQEQEITQDVAAKAEESGKELNFRVMRERAERAEKRTQELERYLQAQQQVSPAKPAEEEDDMRIEDDSYLEGRVYKNDRRQTKNEIKQLRKQQQDFNEQIKQSTAELRLRSQFSDFDSVVTKENIERLSLLEPEDFSSLSSNPDWYAKGKTAYNMIKRYGVIDKYAVESKKVQENLSKPRSAGNVSPQASDSPLTKVGEYGRRILSEKDKDAISDRLAAIKRYR